MVKRIRGSLDMREREGGGGHNIFVLADIAFSVAYINMHLSL